MEYDLPKFGVDFLKKSVRFLEKGVDFFEPCVDILKNKFRKYIKEHEAYYINIV